MESEVLKALLVVRIPTFLFVMNRFTDVNNIQIEQALKENRMLIVVLKRDDPKGRGQTPRLRNEYVLSLCQHVVCGYFNKNGSVFPLLVGRTDVWNLINEKAVSLAAEPETKREHWTVALDKVLLRMYYADMGIKTLGDICPESNRHPDFVFDYQGKGFAVECKWREKLPHDLSRDILPEEKISIYQQFSVERNIPVFIVLGVGDEPSNPELLYNILGRNEGTITSRLNKGMFYKLNC